MKANFLFWKISSQASLKEFLNFFFEKVDHVIYLLPQVHLVGNFKPPLQHESTFCSWTKISH